MQKRTNTSTDGRRALPVSLLFPPGILLLLVALALALHGDYRISATLGIVLGTRCSPAW